MIQSGVLRIFRMAVRGVCSLSALPVCFVSLLVRPVLSALSALSALSCSVLFCPVLSCSVRSSIRPFVHSFGCFASCPSVPSVPSVLSARPTVRLSVCPFVHSFGCSVSCSSVLSARPSACFVSPSLCSFVPVRSARFVSPLIRVRPLCPFCPLCLSAPSIYLPVPLRSRRILFRRFRQVLCFFSAG